MVVDMAESTRHPDNPPEFPSTVSSQVSEQTGHNPSVDADELLELLGDEYTYRVFETVVEQPRTGREIMDATGVSKATVYRRLEELEEAGLVESTLNIAEDGNHCKQFHAVVSSIQVRFDDDGFTASVESDEFSSATGHTRQRFSADD